MEPREDPKEFPFCIDWNVREQKSPVELCQKRSNSSARVTFLSM